MLLPWLALIAAFIGGISFANTISAWKRKVSRSHRFSIFPKQPFSLWSLILFLFFPPASISTSEHFTRTVLRTE